jgi:hypothetical protein
LLASSRRTMFARYAICRARNSGSHQSSPSRNATHSPRAASTPVLRAPEGPRFSWTRTCAAADPRRSARAPVEARRVGRSVVDDHESSMSDHVCASTDATAPSMNSATFQAGMTTLTSGIPLGYASGGPLPCCPATDRRGRHFGVRPCRRGAASTTVPTPLFDNPTVPRTRICDQRRFSPEQPLHVVGPGPAVRFRLHEHAPRISVVIPCYNQGRFLGEAIASALGQTTAGSRSHRRGRRLGRRHAGRGGEVRRGHYASQPNRGLAQARNRGLPAEPWRVRRVPRLR